MNNQTKKTALQKAREAQQILNRKIEAAGKNPDSKVYQAKQKEFWKIAKSFSDDDFIRLGKKGSISEKQLIQCFKFRCKPYELKYDTDECNPQISALMDRGSKVLKQYREKIGACLGDEIDTVLTTSLINDAKKAIANSKGYLYFKCWKISSKDQWYKIGITNDLKRRDVEQNVLPVKAETIAYTKFSSMEEASAAEKAFHSCLKKYKVKGAGNRELFNLSPSKVAAIIAAMKAIKK